MIKKYQMPWTYFQWQAQLLVKPVQNSPEAQPMADEQDDTVFLGYYGFLFAFAGITCSLLEWNANPAWEVCGELHSNKKRYFSIKSLKVLNYIGNYAWWSIQLPQLAKAFTQRPFPPYHYLAGYSAKNDTEIKRSRFQGLSKIRP